MIIDENVRPAYIETPQGRIHHLESGSGNRAIALFHETPLSSKTFLPAVPYLAKRVRVIAFDTPGYGGSSPPAGPPSIESYCETLWSAIQQLGIEELAVCGIHTGASIAVELASRERQGPKIVGAVLSGVPLVDASGQAHLAHLANRDERDDTLSPRDVEEIFLKSWNDHVQRWVRPPVELLVQALADELAVFPNRNEGFKAVRDHDIRAAVARVQVPVLLLNGEKDSLAVADAANVALFRDGRLEILKGWGGQLQGSAPKLYAEHVLNFLLPKFSH